MKMFIDGQQVDASDHGTLNVVNSATGEFIDTVPAATAQDVAHAIDVAQRGKVKWARTPAHERSRLMLRCADAIDEQRDVALPSGLNQRRRDHAVPGVQLLDEKGRPAVH